LAQEVYVTNSKTGAITEEKLGEANGLCPTHSSHLHCWHESGSKSFKGKYEERTPVQCCHCMKTATKVEFRPNKVIEYDR
jgi:hypothetical protein